MKLIGKGFMKMILHRHYFLGLSILMSFMLGSWVYSGTASNALIILMSLTIAMDLLCWALDVNNNGKGRFFTFTFSTKKGDKNV